MGSSDQPQLVENSGEPPALKSIQACHAGDWSIVTWRKDGDGEMAARPFVCKSWRHEGDCRKACGECDLARVCQAIRENLHWTYLVITYPHRSWKDPTQLFRWGVVHWSRMRKRLVEKFGKMKYIQTWEVHKSGWPHVNVIISNQNLHFMAVNDRSFLKREVIDPMGIACGFGFTKWLKPVYDEGGIAFYLTKLGLELTGAGHKDQVPINAPPHFRRLRASRGLLPKRVKDENITGKLFKAAIDDVQKELGRSSGAREDVAGALQDSSELRPFSDEKM